MPWTRYKIGKKSADPKWTNPDCLLLDTISHVVHLETAARILKDGKIKSNIISASSSLEVKNTSVAWFSPNYWAHGSRYGNVEFVFDFIKLIEGKNVYWAGVKGYGVKACCFLITNKKLGKEYKRYDPSKDEGPWQYSYDEEEFYWNGEVALEFMFESDILIKECKDIVFRAHHNKFCNIDASKCEDILVDNSEAGKRFIANIIANDLPVQYHFFGESGGRAKSNIALVYKQFLRSTVGFKFDGNIRSKSAKAGAVARAALNFHHLYELDNFESIVSMFKSNAEFNDTLLKLIAEKFKITAID